MEFIETGNIKRIQYEQDEKTVVSGVFRGIYGVGTTVAYDWYSCGLRTLDDVKERKFGIKLTPAQEVRVSYRLHRIPSEKYHLDWFEVLRRCGESRMLRLD